MHHDQAVRDGLVAARSVFVDATASRPKEIVRPMTSGGLGDEPRCVASRVLQLAIDDMAGIITCDREYFWGKNHSLAQGPRGC